MKVELLGSMLVFGFLALFGKMRRRWLIYAVLMVVFWQSYYLAFVLGIALCDLTTRSWSPKNLAWPITAALAVAGLWLGAAPIPGATSTIYSAIGWPHADPNVVFVLTHIAGAAMLLSAVVYSPALRAVFASRPLRYLGRVSFSMYLLHLLVLGTISSYMFTVLSADHGYLMSLAVTGAAYLVIVLIVSDIYTRHVDEPSMKLANWLTRRIMSPLRPKRVPEPLAEPDMISSSRANASNI
jgi:peptidoglycan/LPS O-acetylase OafA/YrhL